MSSRRGCMQELHATHPADITTGGKGSRHGSGIGTGELGPTNARMCGSSLLRQEQGPCGGCGWGRARAAEAVKGCGGDQRALAGTAAAGQRWWRCEVSRRHLRQASSSVPPCWLSARVRPVSRGSGLGLFQSRCSLLAAAPFAPPAPALRIVVLLACFSLFPLFLSRALDSGRRPCRCAGDVISAVGWAPARGPVPVSRFRATRNSAPPPPGPADTATRRFLK